MEDTAFRCDSKYVSKLGRVQVSEVSLTAVDQLVMLPWLGFRTQR
jgi:hypothetical protein